MADICAEIEKETEADRISGAYSGTGMKNNRLRRAGVFLHSRFQSKGWKMPKIWNDPAVWNQTENLLEIARLFICLSMRWILAVYAFMLAVMRPCQKAFTIRSGLMRSTNAESVRFLFPMMTKKAETEITLVSLNGFIVAINRIILKKSVFDSGFSLRISSVRAWRQRSWTPGKTEGLLLSFP